VFAVLAALLLGACRHQTAAQQKSQVDAYMKVRELYAQRVASGISGPGDIRQYADSAMKDLETRLRVIVGPVSVRGRPSIFNSAWPYREGTEGGELDALRFGKYARDTVVLLTHRDILAAWVRAEGDSAGNPFVGLARPEILTWVFGYNAAVSVYADLLKRSKLPSNVKLALLISHSQDQIPTTPQSMLVAVQKGDLVYLVLASAATIPPPEACVERFRSALFMSEYTPGQSIGGRHPGFLACYDSLVASRPEFQQAMAQAHALRAFATEADPIGR
jgi:hypothetical protein